MHIASYWLLFKWMTKGEKVWTTKEKCDNEEILAIWWSWALWKYVVESMSWLWWRYWKRCCYCWQLVRCTIDLRYDLLYVIVINTGSSSGDVKQVIVNLIIESHSTMSRPYKCLMSLLNLCGYTCGIGWNSIVGIAGSCQKGGYIIADVMLWELIIYYPFILTLILWDICVL